MRRILIVQTGFLGDAVLATAMLRAREQNGTPCNMGLMIRSSVASMFGGHPGIWRLHALDKSRSGATSSAIQEIREAQYDVAIIVHRSFRSALVPARAGVPVRAGFRVASAPWLYTHRLPYRIADHEIDRNATLLASVGLVCTVSSPWIVPDSDALSAVKARFTDHRRTVVVAPGSVWATKRWTVTGYGELTRTLASRGLRPIIVGTESEADICRDVGQRAGIPPSDVVPGELSLVELAALIADADRVFANDSAPVHIAQAVGTPVTAMYGPTTPEFGFRPRGPGSACVEVGHMECRPCTVHGSHACPLGHHRCMTELRAEVVLHTIEQASTRTNERDDDRQTR